VNNLGYWDRVAEIRHLQWELLKDYWVESLLIIVVFLALYYGLTAYNLRKR